MSCDRFEGFVIGTCDAMCPSDERLMWVPVRFQYYKYAIRIHFLSRRTREKLLHFYERVTLPNGQHIADKSKVVKEFARSAAGIQQPKRHQLRTPATLQQTVRYLLTDVVNDTRKPFHVAYDFIFDRLRAVRQEIVMQNLEHSITIQLLEPIVMFLAYSMYRYVIIMNWIFLLISMETNLSKKISFLGWLQSPSINSIRKFVDNICKNV